MPSSCLLLGEIIMIDLESVAYGLARDYPGGVPAIAARAGMNATLLSNKLNPNDTRHHLMVNESLSMQEVSGDHRIVHAEAHDLGYALVKLPEIEDGDVTHATMASIAAVGEMIGACDKALRDGRVTPNEMHQIEKRMLNAVAHITLLHAVMAAKTNTR
jgi:hypothetical protein